jgi:CheY-like chemotaxis protein
MDLEKILALTKNLNVLIVEDELALRESFQFLLQNLFAEVDTAEDGQEALNKMDERDYDIVLTDLSMPRMSGLRLVDTIRMKSQSQIVVAISAHDDKEFSDALAPYNVKLLTKPLEMDKLFETLVPLCEQLR